MRATNGVLNNGPRLTQMKRRFVNAQQWSNCVLQDDEAVYWISIGHYEAVAVGN